MNSSDFKLRERVKELNCLYALSKLAWETTHDLNIIVKKTLELVPTAMQFPALAEARLTLLDDSYSTNNFQKCKVFIEAILAIGQKKYGKIVIGYRHPANSSPKPRFLKEEQHLLKAVARELTLILKRASVEEEKEKLKLQLQHVERLAFVGELSAGIAHEINEPLGRILGFAQLIKKAGNLDAQQDQDIERIIKASLYTREIIKKLMIFSRQMPQQISRVDVNNVIENILYFIDVRFQSREIHLVKHLDDKLPNIYVDEVQISQVLVNLISNAIHAMPQGGKIVIASKLKKSHISLSIKDTGIGMEKAQLKKIFEPFYTTKPVGQGTGLGLSVVQGIIDSHKGRIVVSSTPDKGSKFEILLPVKREKRK